DGTNGDIIMSFYAYDPGFRGGVNVAGGDIDGDGRADVIAGAGNGGAPHVAVFSGRDGHLLESFMAFDPSFRGGVNLATGDVDLDGTAEIIFGAGAGGGPAAGIIDARTGALEQSFFGFDEAFRGGVRVASSDLNGDRKADLVLASGPGILPQAQGSVVRTFNGQTLKELDNFYPFDPHFAGGVYVG